MTSWLDGSKILPATQEDADTVFRWWAYPFAPKPKTVTICIISWANEWGYHDPAHAFIYCNESQCIVARYPELYLN